MSAINPFSRRRLWLTVGFVLIASGWFGLAASGLVFEPFNRPVTGLKLGIAFGQATLAACWLALGRGSAFVRLAATSGCWP
jgi:hypothetical protein